MKYIDADRLKAEIKGFRNIARERVDDEDTYFLGMAQGYDNSISIIDSLQQEQPKVDLEKEMTAYIERHFHIRYDETLEVGNDPLTTHDFEEIARHFAEWGAIHLNARKEEP